MTPQEELNESLRLLRSKIDESISIALEARDKLGGLINHSHLKSTISMLQNDIVLRKMMEQGL